MIWFLRIEKCKGFITEEGGLTSHAAVVGLSLGIPVIVGVNNATNLIKNGQELTIDAESGVIYHGTCKYNLIKRYFIIKLPHL